MAWRFYFFFVVRNLSWFFAEGALRAFDEVYRYALCARTAVYSVATATRLGRTPSHSIAHEKRERVA